jgi:POT family proton-dependent oligopeptide transporter
LEFFYTQAPKRMKSLMMAIFLTSVFVGNSATGLINMYIQIPSVEIGENAHPGFDETPGTEDDLKAADDTIVSPAKTVLQTVATRVVDAYKADEKLPFELGGLPEDPWGQPLRYQLVHAGEARVVSDGPDRKPYTKWDLGITLTVKEADTEEEGTWLHKAKLDKGMLEEVSADPENPLALQYTAGGGLKLEGASYFWFFTKLMLLTAILFIPFAMLYKPRTYLQGDDEDDDLDEEMEAVAEIR